MTSSSLAIEPLLQGQRICSRYRLDRLVSESFYVQVWRVVDVRGGRYIAKLTAKAGDGGSRTSHEAELNVFFSLTGGHIGPNQTFNVSTPVGFPNILSFGRHENQYDFIIIQFLSTDVYNIGNRIRWRTLATTRGYLALFDDMITALMTLHQHGFVHRNVKPLNIRISNSSIAVLHDFSASKRYIDVAGYHFSPGRERIFIGTLEYASINAHRLVTQSRRDDLISLGYTIIDVMRRGLPWSAVRRESRSIAETANLILNSKENTSLESLCHGLPHGIASYMRNVLLLSYYDTPDYNLLRAMVGPTSGHSYWY